MSRYSKKAELTGSQSVLDAERDVKKYAKILEIAMNPDEFEVIWSKISPAVTHTYIIAVTAENKTTTIVMPFDN